MLYRCEMKDFTYEHSGTIVHVTLTAQPIAVTGTAIDEEAQLKRLTRALLESESPMLVKFSYTAECRRGRTLLKLSKLRIEISPERELECVLDQKENEAHGAMFLLTLIGEADSKYQLKKIRLKDELRVG